MGKTIYAYFPLGPSSPPSEVAKSNERLANRTRKRVLCVGVVKQTQSAWFIRANECTLKYWISEKFRTHKPIFTALETIVLRKFGHPPVIQNVRGNAVMYVIS